MGDKVEELGQGTFGCLNDCDVCCHVGCCGAGLHYVDVAARFNLMPRPENVKEAKKCCGLCFICYMATVEDRLNQKLGGSSDYNKKCCCYYCCGGFRQCMFLRAVKAIENRGMLAAPQSQEMIK